MKLKSSLKMRKLKTLKIGAGLFVLIILLAGTAAWFARPTLAAWWPGGTSWLKRQHLTVNNNSPQALSADTTIAITIDTQTLYNQGKLKSDCSDIRIVYQPDYQTATDLDRYISYPGGGSCSTSAATKVFFKLQATLNANSSSSDYFLYYGNSGASAPLNPEHAFDIGSNAALLVCPFDGTTTCIASGSGTPASQAGAIRYSDSHTAIDLNGSIHTSDSIGYATNPAGLTNLPTQNLTIEWWQYMKSKNTDLTSGFTYYVTADYGCTSSSNGWGIRIDPSTGAIYAYFIFSPTSATALSQSNAIPLQSWAHVAVTLDGQAKTVRIFVNGNEVSYQSKTTGSGTYKTETDHVRLGQAGCDTGKFHGLLDELRISNTIRYSANFTPIKTPFIRDAYTKLLFHFDENGSDPLASGNIVDDSGNNYNMPYTGPVFYASGIVGVESATNAAVGLNGIPSETFAGHDGVFIEEGTTNKILNPSFENSSFATGWTASASATVTDQTDPTWVRFGTHSASLLSSSLYDSSDNWATSGYASSYLYKDTTAKRLSQKFQPTFDMNPSKALLFLNTSGYTGPYWYHVEIQSDNSGTPSGTPVTNGTSDCLSYATLHTFFNNSTAFSFSTAPALNASTPYHLVLKAYTDSGCTAEQSAADSANYVSWALDQNNHYSGGDSEIMSETGSWTTQTGKDLIFQLNQDGFLTTSVNTGDTNVQTLSAYVFNLSPNQTGGTIDSSVAQLVFQGVPQTTAYAEAGGGWWRLTYSAAGTNSPADYGIEIKSGKQIATDGVQLEEAYWGGVPYPTSYADGSLGNGYAWTGTPNNSTSTRTFSTLQYSTTNNVQPASGAISFWLKTNWTTTSGSTNDDADIIAIGGQTDGVNGSLIFREACTFVGCGWQPALGIRNNSGSVYEVDGSFDFIKDSWSHFVIAWNTNDVRLYRNGVSIGTPVTTATMPSSWNSNIISIGAGFTSNPNRGGSTISDLRIFNTPLTSTNVSDLYNAGLVSHSNQYEEDQFTAAAQSKGTNPIAVYHFDEGYGTIAHDSSTFKNDLDLYGAAFDATDSGNFRSDLSRNLMFNGTSAYASRSAGLSSDFNFGLGSFTIAGWFRSPPTGSGQRTIISKYSTAGYQVYLNPTGALCFGIDDDSSWGPDSQVCSPSTIGSLADSHWHHFEAVKDFTSSITIYIDGHPFGSNSNIINGSLDSTSNLNLGTDPNHANYWRGNLDEIMFYAYARNADQVKADYLGPRIMATLGKQASDPLTNGLVGYWKMDEATWSGTLNEVIDSSNNGNHGQAKGATNGKAYPAIGKYGNGGSLDGVDDYIEIPNFSL